MEIAKRRISDLEDGNYETDKNNAWVAASIGDEHTYKYRMSELAGIKEENPYPTLTIAPTGALWKGGLNGQIMPMANDAPSTEHNSAGTHNLPVDSLYKILLMQQFDITKEEWHNGTPSPNTVGGFRVGQLEDDGTYKNKAGNSLNVRLMSKNYKYPYFLLAFNRGTTDPHDGAYPAAINFFDEAGHYIGVMTAFTAILVIFHGTKFGSCTCLSSCHGGRYNKV